MTVEDAINILLTFPMDAELMDGHSIRPRPITRIARVRLTKGGHYSNGTTATNSAIVVCNEFTETQNGFEVIE